MTFLVLVDQSFHFFFMFFTSRKSLTIAKLCLFFTHPAILFCILRLNYSVTGLLSFPHFVFPKWLARTSTAHFSGLSEFDHAVT